VVGTSAGSKSVPCKSGGRTTHSIVPANPTVVDNNQLLFRGELLGAAVGCGEFLSFAMVLAAICSVYLAMIFPGTTW
jgi:hypothetical protein